LALAVKTIMVPRYRQDRNMLKELNMLKNDKKRLVFLVITISVFLLATACGADMRAASQGTAQEAKSSAPTIIIQQFVTQVVATPLPVEATPVPPPTTPVQVVNTGWDPLSAPIYYPLMGCVASRLYVGDRAFVAYGADRNGIHYSEDIGDAPIYRYLTPGEIMEIVDGPYCERGAVVWKVFALADEQVGFVAEGDGNFYWLLPLPPGDESAYKEYINQDSLMHIFAQGITVYKNARGCTKNSR
jgi:hypothetical protein